MANGRLLVGLDARPSGAAWIKGGEVLHDAKLCARTLGRRCCGGPSAAGDRERATNSGELKISARHRRGVEHVEANTWKRLHKLDKSTCHRVVVPRLKRNVVAHWLSFC